MKKKLTVTTVLVLLLAMCLTMLVGCDEMFTKNEERDGMQVVATVHYEGETANIYKFELASQFNNYAYAYHNYYQMSYEDIANYFAQSLAQQKLLAMYARHKVTELMDLDAAPEDIAELLTRSELNRAIENTNEGLMTVLKSRVEESVNEDYYNSGTDNDSSDKKDEEEDVEITDGVNVRFESNGGSAVERQRIQKGHKAKEPKEPTKEGYTFYGWYQSKDFSDEKEFDFEETTISNTITLYAKWVEFTAPRTEMPEVEEEDDYDPDLDDETVEISKYFFDEEYFDTIYEKMSEEDFAKKLTASSDRTLKEHIEDSMASMKKDIAENLFKTGIADEKERMRACYEYELYKQIESILITKMQRLIGKTVDVTEEEIEAEFNRIVDENKQTFTGANADSSYSSALTGKLDSTYYHTSTEDSYGFVVNILLRLDDDSLKVLKDMYNANPSNTKAIEIMRNRLISQMEIKISNPEYDSSAIVKDDKDNEIELRDPMTDPKNPYNNVGKTPDTSYQKEGGNIYNQLISFEKKDGKFEIVFNATEHPAMAYLLEKHPAFDKDGKTGIIHQIYNSFEQVNAFVKSGELSREQGVYWLRQIATKWLYLVGDDSGAVTDSSNNNGLGYLISPEGKESSYLSDFTDYARALIKKGTGAYVAGDVANNTFLGAADDGTIAGNGVAYVVADSFLGTGTKDLSNAYAGVFVLLNSYSVWDSVNYENMPEDGTLPMDYVMTYGKDEDDIKTIKEIIEDSLLTAKRAKAYNLDVNTMGVKYTKDIEYFEKAYKSLWKDLD